MGLPAANPFPLLPSALATSTLLPYRIYKYLVSSLTVSLYRDSRETWITRARVVWVLKPIAIVSFSNPCSGTLTRLILIRLIVFSRLICLFG